MNPRNRTLRAKFLKERNGKLIWKQALENTQVLKEYSAAMDVLSKQWVNNGDGVSRIEWAKIKINEYFETKRDKFIRKNEEIKP